MLSLSLKAEEGSSDAGVAILEVEEGEGVEHAITRL